MTVRKSRLDSIYSDMSASEKARLVLESFMSDRPLLDEAEKKKLMQSLSAAEGLKFNQVVDEFNSAWEVLQKLVWVVNEIFIEQLERDKLLWFLRALGDLAERVSDELSSFDDEGELVSPVFGIRCFFATVRVGWSDDYAESKAHPVVQPEPKLVETLEVRVTRLRAQSAEAKAAEAYVRGVAMRLRLPMLRKRLDELIEKVSRHDRPTEDELIELIMNDVDTREIKRPVFPIAQKWALVWEDVEVCADAADRLMNDPEGWIPSL